MRSHLRIVLVACVSLLASGPATTGLAAGRGGQIPHILTLREQNTFYNASLKVRLEQIVPEIMREEGIDLWLVICRENNEDPVYRSLVPFTTLYASRLQILVFHDRGAAGVERFSVNFRQMGEWYKSVWDPTKMDQWARLAEVIRERNPKVIGIDESPEDQYGDGLTASLKAQLVKAIGPEYREASEVGRARGGARPGAPDPRRTDPLPAGGGHRARDHRRCVLEPGDHARGDDDRRCRVVDAPALARSSGSSTGSTRRSPSSGRRTARSRTARVIQRGDLLHCDFGIVYLNLCTDTQQQAYVLKEGETDAPAGMKRALALGNRLQDIHMEEMKPGRTGNQVLAAALKRAKAEGLRPQIYSHPLGVHGHAAGAPVGHDRQAGRRAVRGRLPVLRRARCTPSS